MKVLSIFGTRPEAIKMCPLIKQMEACNGLESVVCLTGQHREMLQQVLDIFEIKADYNLDIMKHGQSLSTITTAILNALELVLDKEKPDIVLVHGDTTTSFSAALAAFYKKIPVGHVEAGLRTYNKYFPYPEEMNRVLISRIAELHFAPTKQNQINLNQEGIFDNVFVTGNTVIDSMKTTIRKDYIFHMDKLNKLQPPPVKYILLTAHRRENWGKPHENIFYAVKDIVKKHKDIKVIYPVHPNPIVRDAVEKAFKNEESVCLLGPLDVQDMHNLINKSYLIMTDSGGLQEEAPSCGGVPVVVLRNETERMEAVNAGTVILAGTDRDKVFNTVDELLSNADKYIKMSKAINPYGDGMASERIVRHIFDWYRRKNET